LRINQTVCPKTVPARAISTSNAPPFGTDRCSSLPSLHAPLRVAGRGRGWGGVQHSREQRFLPIDPPPPTPKSELRSSRPRRFRLRRGFGGHVAGGRGEKAH